MAKKKAAKAAPKKPKRPTPAEAKQKIVDDIINSLIENGSYAWPDVDPEVFVAAGPAIMGGLALYMLARRRR